MQPNRRRSRFDAPQPKYLTQMREIFVQKEPEQQQPPNQPGPIMRNIWREEEIQKAREQIQKKREQSQIIEQLLAEERERKLKTLQQEFSHVNDPNIPRRGILRNYTSNSPWNNNSIQMSAGSTSISMGNSYSNGSNTHYNANTSKSFPLVDYSSDEGEDVNRKNRKSMNRQAEDHESLEDLGVMKELKKVLAAVSERSIFSSGELKKNESKQETKYICADSQSSRYENIKWDIPEEEIPVKTKSKSKNQFQAPRIKFQIQPLKEESLESKLKSIKQPQAPKDENKLTLQSSTILNRIRQNKWDAIESKKTSEVQKLIEENKHTSYDFKKYTTSEWKTYLENKSKPSQQDTITLRTQSVQTRVTPLLNTPANQFQNNFSSNYNQPFPFQNSFPDNQIHSLDLKNNFYSNPFHPQNNFSANQFQQLELQNNFYPNQSHQLQYQSQIYGNRAQSYMYNNAEYNTPDIYQDPWNAPELAYPPLHLRDQFNYPVGSFADKSMKPNQWNNKNSVYLEGNQVKQVDHQNFPNQIESVSKNNSTKDNKISNSKYSEEYQVKPIGYDLKGFVINTKPTIPFTKPNQSSKNTEVPKSPSEKKETSTKKSPLKDNVASNKSNNYYQGKYKFDSKSQSSTQSKQQSLKSENQSNRNRTFGSKSPNVKEKEHIFIKPQNPPIKNNSLESNSLREQQSMPTQKLGNSDIPKINVIQKPIKSILKNSSRFQASDLKSAEENKSTKTESELATSKGNSLKSLQANDSKFSQETKSSTPSVKSSTQEKSAETNSVSQHKSNINNKPIETKSSTSPVKSTTKDKFVETNSTSQHKSSINDKSVEIKSSTSQIKSTTKDKLAETKCLSTLKSNTNNKSVETKSNSSIETKTAIKDASKVSKTFDEKLIAIYKIKPLKVVVERLDITKLKSLPKNMSQVKAVTNNILKVKEINSTTVSNKILPVTTKSQETQQNLTKEKDIELVDLSSTDTKIIVSPQKKTAIKLNLKTKVLKNLNNTALPQVKSSVNDAPKATKFEVVEPKLGQETNVVNAEEKKLNASQGTKPPGGEENTENKSVENKNNKPTENINDSKSSQETKSTRPKITPIVWDLPKDGSQVAQSKLSEEKNSVKRRLEAVKWSNDDSPAAKKFKVQTTNNTSTKEEVEPKVTGATASRGSQEEKNTVEAEKKEKMEGDDKRNYRTEGAIFGNLKLIPLDSTIDPPPYACYRCWKIGHKHTKCLTPKYRKFCYNCGRLYVNMYTCPRCKEEHEKFLENKKQNKQQEPSFKDRLGNYVDEPKPAAKNRLGNFVDEEQPQPASKIRVRLGDYIDDDLNIRGKVNVNHPAYREHLERSNQSNYQANSPSLPYNQQQQRNWNSQSINRSHYQSQLQTSRSRSPIRRNRIQNQAALGDIDLDGLNLQDVGPRFVNDILGLLDTLRDRSPETRNTFLKIALDEFKSEKESRLFRD